MKIKIKSQVHENQGIQYRSLFWIGLGIGRWWKIGIGWFSYSDWRDPKAGGWLEIMCGWWRVLFTMPGDL